VRAAARSPIAGAVLLPFAVSRAIVWVSGVVAMEVGHEGRVFDPPRVTAGLGHTANVLLAPALRWDAVWYLTIAHHGYTRDSLASFFPLYPLAIRGLSIATQSTIAAGILISFAACLAALFAVYRLAELDFGPRVAAASVWVLALFPMSFFLSAIYTESLFLALSAGSLYFARRGRWAWAGVLGGLAAATRSIGILLVVPLAILYLDQRRRSSTPRHDFGWIGLVVLGLVGYMVGLAIERGAPFAMLRGAPAHRGFLLAPATIVNQVKWAVDRVDDLTRAGHYGFGLLYTGVPELAFLALAVLAAVGVARRLHPAYAAYVVVVLIVLLCEPGVHEQPLTSFPRYILVLFPLWIWLGLWARERRRLPVLLAVSTLLLVLFTGQFATWHFVA
jgi:4-amino-4-deoxy-L-arabinose transferase-like glycosyltransferase